MFALVVLVGGSILYFADSSSPTIGDEPPSAQEPVAGDEAPIGPAPEEPPEQEPPVTGSGQTSEPAPVGEGAAVIEIEMIEFAYAPDSIGIEAGVPVTLRFTNTGRLMHEAMVGDAHMQEEWASAPANHDPMDGHHGDLMAVTVEPGQTQDLEVVIDEPGTWYMACHIVGHYEQGQVATINVTA